MSTANEPAFPYTKTGLCGDGETYEDRFSGLTKREYFAVMAMQGLLSTLTMSRNESMPFIVSSARQYADALLAELENAK